MSAAVFLAAIIAASAPAQGASLPKPIAPAAQGKLACVRPDTIRKTCLSLDAYKIGADGAIDDVSTMFISDHPTVTMEMITPVKMKSGEVCETLRKQDIDAVKFMTGDHELDADQAELIRRKLYAFLKVTLGHEACAAYVRDGAAIIQKAKVDGVRTPALDQRFIWVSPDEGYTVAP